MAKTLTIKIISVRANLRYTKIILRRERLNTTRRGNEKDEDNEYKAQFSLYTRLEYKLDKDDTTY